MVRLHIKKEKEKLDWDVSNISNRNGPNEIFKMILSPHVTRYISQVFSDKQNFHWLRNPQTVLIVIKANIY